MGLAGVLLGWLGAPAVAVSPQGLMAHEKISTGFKMSIDFVNPVIEGLKTNWSQLPEPVRQVAPFAGEWQLFVFALIAPRHMLEQLLTAYLTNMQQPS